MSVATGARTGFEQFILDRQKQLGQTLGNKKYVISPEEYNKAAVEYFGKLEDTLPQGAKIVQNVSPLEVIYETPDGKRYRAFRNTDSSLGINTGRVQTSLLSSPIENQSAAGEQDMLKALLPNLFASLGANAPGAGTLIDGNTGQVVNSGNVSNSPFLSGLFDTANQLANAQGFVPIDEQTQQFLDTIKSAGDQKLQQQFDDESGSLVANLFGRGINKSNLAGQAAARLSQQHGLVQAQSEADAAQRALQVLQMLTQFRQGNLALAGEQYGSGYQAETGRQNNILNFVDSLLKQALTRETSGVQLSQSQEQIDNQMNQFEQNLGLQRDQFESQAAAQRHAQRMAMINSIIGGLTGAATSLFAPGSGIFGKSAGGGSLKGVPT